MDAPLERARRNHIAAEVIAIARLRRREPILSGKPAVRALTAGIEAFRLRAGARNGSSDGPVQSAAAPTV
nr:hypothetical protein GCM10010200_082290 [Actinomadura rugatobispora]